jgi:hypothetical protein
MDLGVVTAVPILFVPPIIRSTLRWEAQQSFDLDWLFYPEAASLLLYHFGKPDCFVEGHCLIRPPQSSSHQSVIVKYTRRPFLYLATIHRT